jgi:hypothetical protein
MIRTVSGIQAREWPVKCPSFRALGKRSADPLRALQEAAAIRNQRMPGDE